MTQTDGASSSYNDLRLHPLFRGLDDVTVRRIAQELPVERVPPGHVIMTEGDLAKDLFVILTGEIEVLAQGPKGRICVALLGPGDWVGEMAILETQPRSATARALSHCALLRIGEEDVQRQLIDHDAGQYAVLLANIARELSRRLRVADRLIANADKHIARRYVTESMRPPVPR